MNEKKICFISCVNNEKYEQELIRYISKLEVPEDYQIEYLSIWDAKSMCAGYNEGMNSTDAKYKIYLHQDTFIVDRKFIFYMLDIFADEKVGMFGLIGSPKLPDDCVMWDGNRVGQAYYSTYYRSGINMPGKVKNSKTTKNGIPIQNVECVDGFLIATQVDIRWREDIFKYWDFYDISQSFEMRKAGYKVVVPEQGEFPWCLHDDGFMNLSHYEIGRKAFISEYGMNLVDIEPWKLDDKYEEKKALVESLLNSGSSEDYEKIINCVNNPEWFDSLKENDEFASLFLGSTIYQAEAGNENKQHIFSNIHSLSQIKELLLDVRCFLYQLAFCADDDIYTSEMFGVAETLIETFSLESIWRGISSMTPNAKRVAWRLCKILKEINKRNEYRLMLVFINTMWPGNVSVLLELADIYSVQDSGEDYFAKEIISKVPSAFWTMSDIEKIDYMDINLQQWMND